MVHEKVVLRVSSGQPTAGAAPACPLPHLHVDVSQKTTNMLQRAFAPLSDTGHVFVRQQVVYTIFEQGSICRVASS